jgi:dTDP-4-dehydrorhamnose reductase
MHPKIMITGGSGLLARNWIYSRLTKNSIYLTEHLTKCPFPGVNSIKINLDSIDEITSSLKKNSIDICIHTAGLTNVEACEKNPDLAYFANVVLAKNVALACAKLAIPLISISTDHLFSGTKKMYDENDIPEPMNMYASSKARGEIETLEAYPSALIVRTNFFGWGHSYRQSFSDFIIQKLQANQPVNLFTDVFYTPIIATTLANISHDLVEMGACGIYNIVGSERLTKFEFGLKLASVFNLNSKLIQPIHLTQMNQLTLRPKDMSLSNRKLINTIRSPIPTLESQLLELCKQSQEYQFIL